MGKTHKPYLIGFNGPGGIGKSWTATQLQPLLGGAPKVEVMHLMESAWEDITRFPEVRELLDTWGEGDHYTQFKNHVFADRRTGRQVLIDYVESERAKDRLIWLKRMVSRQRYIAADLVLYESVSGFPEETEFLSSEDNCRSFFPVVIAPSHFSPGMTYDDGYRLCMSARWGRRFIDSNTAINHFRKTISDALGGADSTTHEITIDQFWSQLVLGRSLDES